MKTIKNTIQKPDLSGEQIIQKKLNEIRPFIKNLDVTKLPKRQ